MDNISIVFTTFSVLIQIVDFNTVGFNVWFNSVWFQCVVQPDVGLSDSRNGDSVGIRLEYMCGSLPASVCL